MHKLKENTTVLVVDDSPESLGMINMALDQAGISVLIALNGQQALNVIGQITPDVILMDALMPVMDGFECAHHIRQKHSLIPIIFMTGLTEVKHIVQAFEAGGNDYIVKPIHPEELLVRIKQHTNSVRMLTEAQSILDEVRQHVFCVSSKGQVLWSTPDAQTLINEYLQNGSDAEVEFAQRIQCWLASGKEGHDLALPVNNDLNKNASYVLTVHYFKQTDDGEHLLKIQSPNVSINPVVLEESLAITSREAEVLLWLAHGKTNRDIAEILNMSPRTVNKHLEQMYPKIGADNRTAAASVAIQTILGGRIGCPSL